MVELPEPGAGIGSGLKLTVVPDGVPEADRSDRAVEAAADRGRDRRGPLIALLDAQRGRRSRDREARRGAVTVSVTVVFCWMPPPLPVTVMG